MSSNKYLNTHPLQLEKNSNHSTEKLGIQVCFWFIPKENRTVE